MKKIDFYYAFFISLFVAFLVMVAESFVAFVSDKFYARIIFASLFLAGSSFIAKKIVRLSGKKTWICTCGIIAGICFAIIFFIALLT